MKVGDVIRPKKGGIPMTIFRFLGDSEESAIVATDRRIEGMGYSVGDPLVVWFDGTVFNEGVMKISESELVPEEAISGTAAVLTATGDTATTEDEAEDDDLDLSELDDENLNLDELDMEDTSLEGLELDLDNEGINFEGSELDSEDEDVDLGLEDDLDMDLGLEEEDLDSDLGLEEEENLGLDNLDFGDNFSINDDSDIDIENDSDFDIGDDSDLDAAGDFDVSDD